MSDRDKTIPHEAAIRSVVSSMVGEGGGGGGSAYDTRIVRMAYHNFDGLELDDAEGHMFTLFDYTGDPTENTQVEVMNPELTDNWPGTQEDFPDWLDLENKVVAPGLYIVTSNFFSSESSSIGWNWKDADDNNIFEAGAKAQGDWDPNDMPALGMTLVGVPLGTTGTPGDAFYVNHNGSPAIWTGSLVLSITQLAPATA